MESAEPKPTTTSQPQNNLNKMTEQFRVRVLLEPKGFMRCIEVLLAILAFATTAAYQGSVKYNITCNGTKLPEMEYSFGYPFSFDNFVRACNSTDPLKVDAYPGSKASFFVAIGVLAMLYCIVTLIWYVVFEVKFINLDLVPIGDLVLTAVFALFYFLASCAWASGVDTVKYWTDFTNIKDNFYKGVCSNPLNKCDGVIPANYASLNASILFGFLNFVVWLGNCWFVYKETSWFKSRQEAPKQTEAAPDTAPPNDI